MSLLSTPTRTLLLALLALTAHAQTSPPAPSPPGPPTPRKPRSKTPQAPYNTNLILLDPAHGGSDTGAKLAEDSFEKDATVAFADHLKTSLTARGFTVILTHDSASDQLSRDQRAELANRTRAVACILLHASNAGHGVHLFTSSLNPSAAPASDAILPWDSAQALSLSQSTSLAATLSDAFSAIRAPLVVGHVSVPPIDSITCPAVAIELAPLPSSAGATPPSDPAYQQRIADAISNGLDAWRAHVISQLTSAVTVTPPAKPTAPPVTPPVKKPKPQPIPIETPEIVPSRPNAGPPQ